VRTPNVRNGKFVRDELRFTDKQSFREWTARAIPQIGDILITREAPLGEVCLVPSDVRVCLGQRMMLYRPDRDKVDGHFLLYALMSSGVQNNLLKKIGGSTVGHAKVGDIRNLQVPIPPTKPEQEAIAEALSDAVALIDSLRQLLAKKRHLKQGATQDLLSGKKRLPGFSGEWEMKRLGDVAAIRSGGTPSTTQPQFWDGDVLWCTPTDITGLNGFKYLTDTTRKISRLGLISSSAEVIPPNSIVMTSRATIGECAINLVPVSTNQGFKNFIPFENVDVEFLYYLLLTQKQGFIRLCGGSTFLEIGKSQLAAYEVRVPRRAEQTAIAAILSDMDAEIGALEAKLAKTRQLKQGMMQQLLTGRIRLL
jgi:type I restriction enzyme, S subunit